MSVAGEASASSDAPLKGEQMTRCVEAMLSGAWPEARTAAFLRALATRGETAEEIAAAAAVLRAHARPLPLADSKALCDTCGTGGDGLGTINVSTLSALVAAGAGARVVKHGNRAASGRCGSADLLEALGVNLQASPEQVGACVKEVGFGFCFAPAFHPDLKALAPVRKALGIRTLFNLVGPLANPAPISYHLLGVPQPRLLEPMAQALATLGIRCAMVVHGGDGLDEVTTTGVTQVMHVREDQLTPAMLDAQALGIPRVPLAALAGGDVARNAAIAREVLSGARSPYRNLVLINAACALYVAQRASTIAEGLTQAEAALDAGKPQVLLQQVITLTTEKSST